MLTYHQRRPTSREVIHNISLENKLLKLLPHFLGTNELIHHNHYFLSPVQLPSYLAHSRTWGFHKYHHHNTPPRRPPSHPYSAEGRVTLTSHRCRRPAEQQHEFWPQKVHHFWRRECVLDAWKRKYILNDIAWNCFFFQTARPCMIFSCEFVFLKQWYLRITRSMQWLLVSEPKGMLIVFAN